MNRWLFITGSAALLATAVVTAQRDERELRGPEAFAAITDKNERSVALFTEMGKVLQHPRCVNCHPRTDLPLQKEGEPHNPPVARGKDGHGLPGMECETCHGPANVKFASSPGSMPGHPLWHLAPIEMAWEGKSLGEICAQLKDKRRNGGKTLAEIHKHNAEDGLVGWGWNPGPGREAVPGTQAQFGALTKAWIDAGATCPKA